MYRPPTVRLAGLIDAVHTVSADCRIESTHTPSGDGRLAVHPIIMIGHGVLRTMDEDELEQELVSVCRTGIGDELRSVTYFTDDEVEQLYLRSDLERTADLTGFAELERAGFRADELYQNSQLGEYQATVRMFDRGYLTRVIYERCGVWITTDTMSMERFEELASSVKPILAAHVSDREDT